MSGHDVELSVCLSPSKSHCIHNMRTQYGVALRSLQGKAAARYHGRPAVGRLCPSIWRACGETRMRPDQSIFLVEMVFLVTRDSQHAVPGKKMSAAVSALYQTGAPRLSHVVPHFYECCCGVGVEPMESGGADSKTSYVVMIVRLHNWAP